MNKQLLTGLTIVGVAASAGVAYAGVSVIHSVSAEDVTASTAPAQQVTRTIVYQVGGAGQVTINVAGDSLAVNGSAAASGWSVSRSVFSFLSASRFQPFQVLILGSALAANLRLSQY